MQLAPLADIETPGGISPQRVPAGYVAQRMQEIRQTDPRVLAAADAIRRTYRLKTGKGMLPCQAIILAHAAVRGADEFDHARARQNVWVA